jgi:hypothetical protein
MVAGLTACKSCSVHDRGKVGTVGRKSRREMETGMETGMVKSSISWSHGIGMVLLEQEVS